MFEVSWENWVTGEIQRVNLSVERLARDLYTWAVQKGNYNVKFTDRRS